MYANTYSDTWTVAFIYIEFVTKNSNNTYPFWMKNVQLKWNGIKRKQNTTNNNKKKTFNKIIIT